MPDNALSPEAQKLLDARKAAVEELKAIDQKDRPLTEPAVLRLANARLFESNISMRLLAGEPITSAEFKASDEMIQTARGSVREPMEISFRFVGKAQTRCPSCSHVFIVNVHDGKQVEQKPPRQIDGQAHEVHSHADEVAAPKTKALPAPPAPTLEERNAAFHANGYLKHSPESGFYGGLIKAAAKNSLGIPRDPNPTRPQEQ